MDPLEIRIPLSIKDDNAIQFKVKDDEAIKFKIDESIRYVSNVHIDTEANWNAKVTLIGKKGHIYVYSDHDTINDEPVPAIKIGDGLAYLIDIPFVDSSLYHIKNGSIHVTPENKEFWNNKVSCYMSDTVSEMLIFTTD